MCYCSTSIWMSLCQRRMSIVWNAALMSVIRYFISSSLFICRSRLFVYIFYCWTWVRDHNRKWSGKVLTKSSTPHNLDFSVFGCDSRHNNGIYVSGTVYFVCESAWMIHSRKIKCWQVCNVVSSSYTYHTYLCSDSYVVRCVDHGHRQRTNTLDLIL